MTLLPAADTTGDVLEPAPSMTPLWDFVRVEGLFAMDADLSTLAGLDLDVDFIADRDWSETWREGLGPLRFGRLVVLPKSSETPPNSGDVVVWLDPGLAFGTGTHATTALCLDRLARIPLAGARVLDVGSGSGILAIAAGRLGASVVAVDHDPQARRATLDNARYNGVAVDIGSTLDAADGQFDVVLANLVAQTIRDLAGDLVRRLAPGGGLVLSGILQDQVEWVLGAFADYPQCQFEPPALREGWAMLHGLQCPNPIEC